MNKDKLAEIYTEIDRFGVSYTGNDGQTETFGRDWTLPRCERPTISAQFSAGLDAVDALDAKNKTYREIENHTEEGARHRSELNTETRDVKQGSRVVSYSITSNTSKASKAAENLASPVGRYADSSVQSRPKNTSSVEYLRQWLATLDLDTPPGDVPLAAWTLFIDASRALIAEWGDTAIALGWTAADLFGAHPIKPYARIDRAGLCWLIGAGHVVVLTADAAVIEALSGSRLTYRRRPLVSGGDAAVMPGSMPPAV